MLGEKVVVGIESYFYFFFFQAEDGIRDLVRSRGLGDVYKRQVIRFVATARKGRDRSVNSTSPTISDTSEASLFPLSLIHI